MKKKKIKSMKIIFTVIVIFTIFLMMGSIVSYAGEDKTMHGWMWGGGTEADGGLPGDGSNTNFGWISANSTNTGSAVKYGVQIPNGNGNVTGYAWSENLGWISFEPGDLFACPFGNCSARRVDDNLEGWARIVGIKDEFIVGNAGGWQGWIKLSGNNYGIVITDEKLVMGGEDYFKLSEYAWSDELGWIDFSQSLYKPQKSLKICKNSCNSGLSSIAAESLSNSDFLMNKYEKVTLKACYNFSDRCDLTDGDVTIPSDWQEGDSGNPENSAYEIIDFNDIQIEGTRGSSFYSAYGVPKEIMTVTYNDGSGDRVVQFDVNVLGKSGECASDLSSKSSCIKPELQEEIDNLCDVHYDENGNPPVIVETNNGFFWTCSGDDASDSDQCNMEKNCEYIEVAP